MLFNVNFQLEAADEIEALELVTTWVVSPWAVVEHISSVNPITVPPEKLPVVDDGGNVNHPTEPLPSPPEVSLPIVLPPEAPDGPLLDPVVAEFTRTPPNPTRGTRVNFDGTASTGNGDIFSYSWQFGDGDNEVGPVVTHQYTTKGDFTVGLTVLDSAGQTGQSEQTVTVR